MPTESIDDVLDRLVAEYSDGLAAGRAPEREGFLARVPEAHRAGLERSLRMLEVGLASGPRAARALAQGDMVDGFRLERELGRGGMATVWLAHQADLRRNVALKLLRPALALEQRHVDRFRREALAVARLSHPHVVQVFAVGEAQGYHYIAMEYVEGRTLAQALAGLPAERPWTARDFARAAGCAALERRGETYEQCVASVLAEVAGALAAAHALGLVHRDVKPSNILLRKDGRAVVADFGLAKGDADPALSLTGDQIGTPWYMSPEQALAIDAAVDARTDVYSLGVTLYEALAGERPFEGKTALAVLEAIKVASPRALAAVSRECTRDSEAVCARAMARLPSARYANAAELGQDLERIARGEATAARIAEGGPLRRAFTALSASAARGAVEYRSRAEFLGLPLVHVYFGRRRFGSRVRVAKGWIAVGDIALGGLALGGVALGLVSLGGLSAGFLLAFGGMSLGGIAFGGLALGGVAAGGLAIGYLALGGCALGYCALGGYARGVFARGGQAVGAPIDFAPGGTFGDGALQSAMAWAAHHATQLAEWLTGQSL